MSALLRYLTLAAVLMAIDGARATPSKVILRGSIQADLNYNWNSAGQLFDTITNPFNLQPSGPAITASMPAGNFIRYDQGAVPNDFSGGWNGNFAPGAALLYTDNTIDNTNFGPITFTFSTPIYGFGTQFQSESQEAFTASIQVYDANNNLLNTFSQIGFSNNHADNSAMFLGVVDSAAGFSKVVLSVTTSTGNDPFAINALSLNTSHPELLAVPESSSAVLFASGSLLLLWRHKKGAPTCRRTIQPGPDAVRAR